MRKGPMAISDESVEHPVKQFVKIVDNWYTYKTELYRLENSSWYLFEINAYPWVGKHENTSPVPIMHYCTDTVIPLSFHVTSTEEP